MGRPGNLIPSVKRNGGLVIRRDDASQIIEASPEHPYLRLVLELDPTLVSSVMIKTGHPGSPRQSVVPAVAVIPLKPTLLDAVVRVICLLDDPVDSHFLLSPINREIVYRLLQGEQGGRLRHVAVLGGAAHRITAAIDRLRKDFGRPLRIEALARESGMSVSTFHQHFKAITATSRLPFQKQLRLQEARQLMFGEEYGAKIAEFQVGYAEPSPFNQEYKRLFGEPPMLDVTRLRDVAIPDAGV